MGLISTSKLRLMVFEARTLPLVKKMASDNLIASLGLAFGVTAIEQVGVLLMEGRVIPLESRHPDQISGSVGKSTRPKDFISSSKIGQTSGQNKKRPSAPFLKGLSLALISQSFRIRVRRIRIKVSCQR